MPVENEAVTLHTPSLFWKIAKKLPRCDTYLDIGSCDGDISFKFEAIFPNANIMALEADPRNAEKIQREIYTKNSKIKLYPNAAFHRSETISFYQETPESGNNFGTSSIFGEANCNSKKVEVQAIKVSELLSQEKSIGLWMDVEGAAFEALLGFEEHLESVTIAHIEVEFTKVKENQLHTYEDIKGLLSKSGLVPIAFDLKGPNKDFGDVLCVQKKYLGLAQSIVKSTDTNKIRKYQKTALKLLPTNAYKIARDFYIKHF